MIRRLPCIILACLALGFRPAGGPQTTHGRTAMPDQTADVLQTSDNPQALASAACALAKSERPEDHQRLLNLLRSPSFLGRLDSEQDYAKPSDKLRLWRVLKFLADNRAPSAHQVLAQLAAHPAFTENWSRADLLIMAAPSVRPLPPALVKFLDDHCQPGDGFMNLTIESLAANGSPPAVQLLEKKLTAPGFEDDDKIAWMHGAIHAHRNDAPLLEVCERILAGERLPANLRPVLVESLFDHRQEEWYGPDNLYPLPPLERASPEARRRLRTIGQHALAKVPLDARQKKAVEDTLKRLDELEGKITP